MMELRRFFSALILVIIALQCTLCFATELDKWIGEHGDKHSVDGGAANSDNAKGLSLDCKPVQEKFLSLQLGSASLVPESSINDAGMDICYNGAKDNTRRSCCSHDMEKSYRSRVKKDFHQVLQETSSYLKNLLVTNVGYYQDMFLGMLYSARNATETLFSDVYELPVRDSRGPVESLFLDLESYFRRRDVIVEDSVEAFFDHLFPIVFHNNVNDPRATRLDDDYRECLMGVRQDLSPRPFGEVPTRLAHHLSKALGAARTFLDAIHLAVETINATAHLPLDHGCAHALTRLSYCGHCDGYLDIHPCKGFCYNVMRGCLAYVEDVSVRWDGFVSALQRLASNLRGAYDMEEMTRSFHTRVSDAVLHAMETGVKFNDKVRERCGQPQPADQLSPHDADSAAAQRETRRKQHARLLPQGPRLKARLSSKAEMFMRNLVAAKGFFLGLPDTLCSAQRFSAGMEEACWNGQTLGPYNQSVIPMELALQINNPEVQIAETTPEMILALTDTLQHMTKVVTSKADAAAAADAGAAPGGVPAELAEERMQGDQWSSQHDWNLKGGVGSGDRANDGYNYYGNDGGYGHGRDGRYGYTADDEDGYFSGSGSGADWDGGIDLRTDPGRRQGVGQGPNNDRDFTIDDNGPKRASETEAPYVKQSPANEWSGTPGAAAPSSGQPLTLLFCILIPFSLWLNG